MKRILLAVALLALSGASTAYAAGGGIDPEGSLSRPGTLSVGGVVSRRGTNGGEDAGSTPLVRFSYEVFGPGPASPGNNVAGICAVAGDPNNPGAQFRIIVTGPDGALLSNSVVCVPFTTVDGAAVPTLPRPPTLAETWRAADLPEPRVLTDPGTRGITGLETRIWTDGTTRKSIAATIRGFRIVGTALLDRYTISIDGGPAANAPNGRYTFETKGAHTIAIGAVWHGTATLTGPGLDAPIFVPDIGTATLATTRTYPVNEIRSVLQP
jgi:hypothetical protein